MCKPCADICSGACIRVVYGFLETAESLVEQFLWIPFYYEFKCIFLLWLVLPQTKGAAYLFQHFICPFMKTYASHIDPVFGKADQVCSLSLVVSLNGHC